MKTIGIVSVILTTSLLIYNIYNEIYGNYEYLQSFFFLLKREDWTDLEWQFAKALESTYSAVSKLIATDIYKEEHID